MTALGDGGGGSVPPSVRRRPTLADAYGASNAYRRETGAASAMLELHRMLEMTATADMERMRATAGLDTDAVLGRMLRERVPPRWGDMNRIEDTALLAAEAVWARLRATVPHVPAWAFVLRTLRDHGYAPATHEWLYNVKQTAAVRAFRARCAPMVQHTTTVHRLLADQLGAACEVLGCCLRGTYRQNSLRFCANHRGLGLLHALRHACASCRLFSATALRSTGGDAGHQYHNRVNLLVPLVADDGDGENGESAGGLTYYNVRIQRFCSADADGDDGEDGDGDGRRESLCEYVETNAHIVYYPDDGGAAEEQLVPPRSFVRLVAREPAVAAEWIRAEIQDPDTGRWQAVTRCADLRSILRATGWLPPGDAAPLSWCRRRRRVRPRSPTGAE